MLHGNSSNKNSIWMIARSCPRQFSSFFCLSFQPASFLPAAYLPRHVEKCRNLSPNGESCNSVNFADLIIPASAIFARTTLTV